jgi:hypothetical protein
MPYKLRKAPRRELYWVVNKETGQKHSKEPLEKEQAKAQMRALYAREGGTPKKGKGKLTDAMKRMFGKKKKEETVAEAPVEREEENPAYQKTTFSAIKTDEGKWAWIEGKETFGHRLTIEERNWIDEQREKEEREEAERIDREEKERLEAETEARQARSAPAEDQYGLRKALPLAPTSALRRETMALLKNLPPLEGKGYPDFCFFDDLC